LSARAKPPIILGYFALRDSSALTDAAQQAGLADRGSLFIGSYGHNADAADAVHAVPNALYAEMFSIQPKTSRGAYRTRREELIGKEAILGKKYAGEIPLLEAARPLPARDHFSWGLELGRRFRDNLRFGRERMEIDRWQFDEILSEVVRGSRTEAHLRYVTGILQGLHIGRPRLGDQPERGVVWCSWLATYRLPGLPITKTLRKFWEQLDRSALFFVGQEYPKFVSDPRRRAELYAAGQRGLAQSGGRIRKSIANRYVAGFTPGVDTKDPSLGGRVPGQTQKAVRAWRSTFVATRGSHHPVGFAEYGFVRENRDAAVITDVCEALSGGLAKLA
jgi:hypothetical protein